MAVLNDEAGREVSPRPCGGWACCDGGSVRGGPENDADDAARRKVRRLGLRLEYFTVGWNVVEGVVSIAIALAAGSVALLGFGIDRFVEMSSGLVLI